VQLLNVSYDPIRELYTEFNKAFASHWKKQTGEDAIVATSHGGSGSQSRSIQDGSEADVAPLARLRHRRNQRKGARERLISL